MLPYLTSSTGKKYLMAISGLALFGFVLGHLLGNLQIFLGPETMNAYAAFLHSTGKALWIARIGLLVMLVVHIGAAVSLTLENKAARPKDYAHKNYIVASYASRTMHLSGAIVAAYVVYHLLHFTFRAVHPEFGQFMDAQGRHDVYRMVVTSFQVPSIAFAYIVANVLLGTHLSHGFYSMFQSLGLLRRALRAPLQLAARLVGYGIALGYVSIPLSVWMGILQ